MAETDLYAPVKRFLEAQGYTVKGEVGACDIVAMRGDEAPVVVELKQRLNLALILQAVDRTTISDAVYIAFPIAKGRSASWRSRERQVTRLLRRLGLGLLTVSAGNRVVVVVEPGPYRPRQDLARRIRLMKEFTDRVGDPEPGGSASRPRLTVYRQDALRCARALADDGILTPANIRDRTGVQRAGPILRDNHYGWFTRVKPGHYTLTPTGAGDLPRWTNVGPHGAPAPVDLPAPRTTRS